MIDSRISSATNLRDLLAAMRAIEDECHAEERTSKGEYDVASLPTFGGDEPAETAPDRPGDASRYIIWSWDPTNFLVGACVDEMRIVSREDHAEGRL